MPATHRIPQAICPWWVGLSGLCLLLFLSACDPEPPSRLQLAGQGREVPDFSADSAYVFIERQVAFGPRAPGTETHRQTRDWLVERLEAYAGERSVYTQEFTETGYNDQQLPMSNIIASFNPQAGTRIMISAHWDTRPRAEEDEDPDRRDEPIPGADDGGSGVGVILELARIFEQHEPPIGVDLVLFDGEDYGRSGELDMYFLGARHWSANPPVEGYNPRFGVLLDMVGGRDARFLKEQYSLQYAGPLVEQVWELAGELGYRERFPDREGGTVADDHLIVNREAGIPMINIINHRLDGTGEVRFPPYWHTHDDDMDIICRQTLQAVGDLMVELIYNRVE